MNRAPIIEEPTDLVTKVKMSGDEALLVVAHDLDNDPLLFIWDKPMNAEVLALPPDDVNGFDWYSSVLRVPYDPNLDGQNITVVVTDGLLVARRRWTIEVTP